MYVIDTRNSGGKKKSSTMLTISNSLNRIGMDLNSIANREQFGNNRALRQSVLKLSSKCILVSTNITYGTPIVKDCNEIITLANSQVLLNASSNIRKLCSDASREAQDLKKQIESAAHSAENQNGSELEHYGRLGMKWGMHIFGEEKTYQKSMDKVGKADSKSILKRERSEKHKTKGDWRSAKSQIVRSDRKRRKLLRKANRQYRRAHRTMRSSIHNVRKAKRIVNAMNKEFENVKIKDVSTRDVMLGEKYGIDVVLRSIGNSPISTYKKEG